MHARGHDRGGKTVLEGEVTALLAGAGDGIRVLCRDGSKAESVLKKEASVSGIQLRAQAELTVVRARLAAGGAPSALLEKLVEAGCGVEEFVRERASLVDVFQAAVSKGQEVAA